MNKKQAIAILGLSSNCTFVDIKIAYRKLAMIHHPDRGGEAGNFTEIQKAFEYLEKNSIKSPTLKFENLEITLEEAYTGVNKDTESGLISIRPGILQGETISVVNDITYIAKISNAQMIDWQIDGNTNGDMKLDYFVSPFDMIMGCWKKILNIDSTYVPIRIIPGFPANNLIKVAGKGYWNSYSKFRNSRGDLYLKIIPDIKTIKEYSQHDLEKFTKSIGV